MNSIICPLHCSYCNLVRVEVYTNSKIMKHDVMGKLVRGRGDILVKSNKGYSASSAGFL